MSKRRMSVHDPKWKFAKLVRPPNAMTSIISPGTDANRDEQDIHDRDQNRPEQESEDGIKEGRNEPGDRSGCAFVRHG